MLDRLLSDVRYAAMVQAHDLQEGNLLEHTERPVAAAQIATLAWLVASLGPPTRVIETGTNKALFGLLLTHLVPQGHQWRYYTCDPELDAGSAVAVLAAAGVDAQFFHGRSQDRLPELIAAMGEAPHLAWVDGDHSYDGAVFDIRTCMEAECLTICVDDIRLIPEVDEAVNTALNEHPEYVRLELGFPKDTRGIAILARVGVVNVKPDEEDV